MQIKRNKESRYINEHYIIMQMKRNKGVDTLMNTILYNANGNGTWK